MTHRWFALTLIVLLAVAPVSTVADPGTGIDATGDDSLTPAANDLTAVNETRYGVPGMSQLVPGFAVKLTDGANLSALEDWAATSDLRAVKDTPTNDGWAVVAAPAGHIGGGFVWHGREVGSVTLPTYVSGGLADKSYVAAIEPVRTVSLPREVSSLRSESSYTKPAASTFVQYTSRGSQTFGSGGSAWQSDATETSMQTARDLTNADAVNASDGSGQTIAIVDSGCNVAGSSRGAAGEVYGNGTEGSELRLLNSSKDFIQNETVADDGIEAVSDPNGHGSWTAAASVGDGSEPYRGYAPNASLLCLRALGEDGSGSSHTIAQAIRYAGGRADIISLSLGSQVYSQEIADALRYAVQETSTTAAFVATGNSRAFGQVYLASPADTPGEGILAVGAANANTTNVSDSLPAYFSQGGPDSGSRDLSQGVTTGQTVDVVAPGMNVTVQLATSSGLLENRTLSGTSMSTPQVAAIGLLVLDANPGWTNESATFANYLRNSSQPLPHAAQAMVGHGYVDGGAWATKTASNQTQADAMTAKAEARDAGWRAYSDAQGGLVFKAWAGSTGLVP